MKSEASKWMCRYRIIPNRELEAFDIVDTESWTSHYEDRDNIVVATVYDGKLVAAITLKLDEMDLPRTIG